MDMQIARTLASLRALRGRQHEGGVNSITNQRASHSCRKLTRLSQSAYICRIDALPSSV